MSSTLSQPYIVLCLCYGGIICGVIYDVFRLLRYLLPGRLWTAIFDFLFLIAAVVIVVLTLFTATGGAIRLYTFFVFFAGICLQQFSLSALFFSLFHSLRQALFKEQD